MPIVFYGLLAIVFFASLRFKKDDGFLDHNSSNVIKGLFILLVVFHHILLFFPYSGHFSWLINKFRDLSGQLIVTMFFFISGYGILFSILTKGIVYSKTLFFNRFLRIIVYTAIALIPCFIYTACLGITHPIEDYFLAFIGLRTFGNSGWFIFAILVCYLLCSIVYLFNWKNHYIPSLLITIGILAYVVAMYMIKNDSFWTYDTIIAFPIGIFSCLIRSQVNSLLSKRKWIPYVIVVVSFALVFMLRYFVIPRIGNSRAVYVCLMGFANLFLCIFFISLTKVFTLKSKILSFFGNASFAIYIMHLLIVNMFIDLGSIPNENINYLVLFTSTISIGIPMYYIYQLIDKVFTNKIVDFSRQKIKQI